MRKVNKNKKEIKRTQSETVSKSDTAAYEESPLDYVNNVIGDLNQKLFLSETEDVKPVRKKQVSEKPRAPKKASQWEIREELAKKKREEILHAVLKKREKEEEIKALVDKKKEARIAAEGKGTRWKSEKERTRTKENVRRQEES